jgi:hypothetical protein
MGLVVHLSRETFVMFILCLDHFGHIEVAIGCLEKVRVGVEQRTEIIVVVDTVE